MLTSIKNTLRTLSVSALIFLCFSSDTQAASFSNYNLTLKPAGSGMISPVLMTEQKFNAVSLKVKGDLKELKVDFGIGKGWEEVMMHNDYGTGLESLLFTAPTDKLQFKTENASAEKVELMVNLTYVQEEIDGIGGPVDSGVTDLGLGIISRAEWGANEALRVKNPNNTGSGGSVNPCAEIEEKYGDQFTTTSVVKTNEQGQELTWPLSYASKIEKFSVHHSDSEIRDINGDGQIDAQDYKAIVRAIYNFHTVSRGWGDVGYNYMIDPLGNIYEGRYGGEMVVGAHSLCFNHGVIGIAMIGNYQDQTISQPAFKALTQLLAEKSAQHKINPLASSEFNGKYLENIFGHKDVRATSCPGAMLYADLPRIRDATAAVLQGIAQSPLVPSQFDFNAEFVSATTPEALNAGEKTTLTIQFKNTGKVAWNDKTWLYVGNNTNPDASILPVVTGKNFVAADLKEPSVAVGGVGTFEVQAQAGQKDGLYSFQVSPVINGQYKISRASTNIQFQVKVSGYNYEIVSFDLPYGNVFQGDYLMGKVRLKNTGDYTWYKDGRNKIELGTWNPQDRLSAFVIGNQARIGSLVQSEVGVGEIGEFTLNLYVPKDRTGLVTESFVPVVQGIGWLEDKHMTFTVNILKPIAVAKTTKLTSIGDVLPGQKKFIEFEIKNTGKLDWLPSNFHITVSGKDLLADKNFFPITQTVKPGEKVKIGVWIQAPTATGSYFLFVRPKFNGIPIYGGMGGFIKGIYPLAKDIPVKTGPQPQPIDDIDDNVSLPTTNTLEKPFRVRISHEADTAILTADKAFSVLNESNQTLLNAVTGAEVTVTKNGNQFEIKNGNEVKNATIVRLVPKEMTGVTEIKTMERRPSWNTSLNDNRFRGTTELRIIDNKVAYINELPMEDYIKGLAEVSNSAPTEKQKVLAVLARTYARFYMDDANRKFPGMPYDGNDDPAIFQKYLGYGVEIRSPNFVKAAEATKDIVVTYGGELVKTPYFNQSDGKTRSAQEVWGWTNTPYLISVPDPWSEGMTLQGHGVGLSGLGATKQAEAGKLYDQIIKYYYKGVAVEKLDFK